MEAHTRVFIFSYILTAAVFMLLGLLYVQPSLASPASALVNLEKNSSYEKIRRINTNEVSYSAREKRAIQQSLKVLGFYNSSVDGQFGPGTRIAIKAFQRAASLEVTGFLSKQQANFLIDEDRKRQKASLDAFKNQQKEKESTKINQLKEMQVLEEKKIVNPIKKAKERTFNGKYGGQWFGTVQCNTSPVYRREISMQISGSKVIVDNFADYKSKKGFSVVGTIELEDSFFLNPGDISVNGGAVIIDKFTYSWNLGGKWDKDRIILRGNALGFGDDNKDCQVEFVPGISAKVENIRITAAAYSKTIPDNSGSGGFMSNLFKPSSTNSNQQPQKTTNNGALGLMSSVGSPLSLASGVLGELIDDPIFQGRSSVEAYIATTRLLHLATKTAARGIVEASLALGLKEEKDIPQYLLDVQFSTMDNSFTKEIQEQDTKVIEYASSAAEEIKNKLSSGNFKLSAETQLQLANAYEQLKLAEIYQAKTTLGVAVIGLNIANADALNELQAFVNNSESASQEIPKVLGNLKDFIFNFGDIIEVAEVIEDTKDITKVALIKEEFIEEAASKEINESVLDDLESAAG